MLTELPENASAESPVRYIRPNGLPRSGAFTNVIVVTGSVRAVYVGGQDAVDESGVVVGKGDIETQAQQVLKNLQTALVAGGATLAHVVKWNVYVVQDQPPQPAFEVFQRVWDDRPNPPAITLVFVSGLAHPDFLLETDAVAVVPQQA